MLLLIHYLFFIVALVIGILCLVLVLLRVSCVLSSFTIIFMGKRDGTYIKTCKRYLLHRIRQIYSIFELDLCVQIHFNDLKPLI